MTTTTSLALLRDDLEGWGAVVDETGAYSAAERLVRLETKVDNLGADVRELRDSGKRPSWAVVTILSLSTLANGALLAAVVAFATSGHH